VDLRLVVEEALELVRRRLLLLELEVVLRASEERPPPIRALNMVG
jgi:hypothetical protein